MTGCDLNNGYVTEQSKALEKMGAERPEVLVLLKSSDNNNQYTPLCLV